MTKPKPILTDDGSYTLYHPEIEEHYHSTFGAIQESKHVFIMSGLDYLDKSIGHLNILEIGLGTGLNALLSLKWSQENKKPTEYTAIEPYPISPELAERLKYHEILHIDKELVLNLHSKIHDHLQISTYFSITKLYLPFMECPLEREHFDVVFFDAFSPDSQPELWTAEVFKKVAASLKPGGVLTTYSSKGVVKRALKSAGFGVEKITGPPGKREIVRAVKK